MRVSKAGKKFYGSTLNRGCPRLRSTCCFCIASFGIRVRGGDSPEAGHCSRVGALLLTVGAVLEELVLLLHELHNQISCTT